MRPYVFDVLEPITRTCSNVLAEAKRPNFIKNKTFNHNNTELKSVQMAGCAVYILNSYRF